MPTADSAQLLHNGHLHPTATFALPQPNRASLYGDGCFETLVWAGEQVRYLSHHLARLHRAAAVLRLALPPELQAAADFTALVRRLTTANHLLQARLRLQVWRSGGGLYLPETNRADYLLTASPLTTNDTPIARADFAQTVNTLAGPLAFCKGPQAWLYVLAAQERQQRGLAELVLLDAAGNVAEGVAAAVFWIKAGALYTPSLTTGCVAGVRRAHLLSAAEARGLPCRVGLFRPEQVLAADAVFMANVAGLRPVQQLNNTIYDSEQHELLRRLRLWEADG